MPPIRVQVEWKATGEPVCQELRGAAQRRVGPVELGRGASGGLDEVSHSDSMAAFEVIPPSPWPGAFGDEHGGWGTRESESRRLDSLQPTSDGLQPNRDGL